MAHNGHTDLVAIRLPAPDAPAAIVSAWDQGAAVVVLDAALPAGVSAALIARARPTAIVDRDGRRDLENGEPVPSATAAVVLTSGTTSSPQAVALTRQGMEAMAAGYQTAIGLDLTDRWLCCLPMSGVAGLAIVARSYVTGVALTMHNGFDPARVAMAPAQEGTSIVSLVPTMLHRLLESDLPVDGFATIVVGGAPLPAPLRRRAEAAGARVATSYGMTETWGGCALDGVPIAGCEIRIGRDDEIQVRGPMVMAGYHGDATATAGAFTGDGWLRTGDMGQWQQERLVVTGRLRDVIITGGVNVNPAAVEEMLRGHPAVADIAVAGRPDEEWGEAIVAFVIPTDPRAPPTLESLREIAKREMAAAAAPRHLVLVEAIPRNAAGKISRDKLV